MALPKMLDICDVIHAVVYERVAKAHGAGVLCAKMAPGFYEIFKIDTRRLFRMVSPFGRIRRLVDVTVAKLRRLASSPLYANELESRPVTALSPIYELGSIDKIVVALVVDPKVISARRAEDRNNAR